MIITIGSTKGGVGKSTLALNVAIFRALQGRKVWLIDADRQPSAFLAMQARQERQRSPGVHCTHLPDGQELHSQVSNAKYQFDDVVIDSGGRDSSALRAALLLSDVIVIPLAPRAFDFWALYDLEPVLKEAKSLNSSLRVMAVLNGADAAGSDNEAVTAALNEFKDIEFIPTPIGRRKSVAAAAGAGLSVLEYKPKDKKAVDEITAFCSHFFHEIDI